MIQIKIVKGPTGVGRSFPLPTGSSVTVGRADSCEVKLPSVGISKLHCRLRGVSGSKAEVEDLGSSNGTFVNGLLVKKHPLKPGDTITLNDFVLSIGIEAPKMADAPVTGNPAFEVPQGGGDLSAPEDDSFGAKVIRWLENNVYPWADKLSEKFDLRVLVASFFLIWSVLIIILTVSPFAQRANLKVREESVQVAKLYARQVVRQNQQAIVDQRYRELTTELDFRKGQTPGILETYILDVTKTQILAPTDLLGRGLPNEYASKAITKDTEYVQFDAEGVAYVSAPIKVGRSDGQPKTVATVLVIYDTVTPQFSFSTLLDQAVTSLLYALIVSVLLFLFLYRWIEGSLLKVAARIDEALKSGETNVTSTVAWPALEQVAAMASSALAKASGESADAQKIPETEWAAAAASMSPIPAAAFDSTLKVIAWNLGMEQVIGIRATIALGADISGASRDVSFEASIRDLASQTAATPWMPKNKRIEFSGRFYQITMLFGQGAHFVTIHPVEE